MARRRTTVAQLVEYEEDFQQRLTETAELCGWRVYHTRNSRGSKKGFPDLILVKDGILLALELKRGEKERRATPQEQLDWIEDLGRVETVYAQVVTPADEPMIKDLLTGRKQICKT